MQKNTRNKRSEREVRGRCTPLVSVHTLEYDSKNAENKELHSHIIESTRPSVLAKEERNGGREKDWRENKSTRAGESVCRIDR